MKTIKFLTMAAAALMMAACSSDELESVAKKAGGMVPLEIVPDVSNQTRAAQITAENLDAFTVDVTGTFVDAGGTEYTNPVLSMTKSGGDWSYSYTDATHATPADGTLYWPLEGQTATFSAHIVDASATVDEKAAQQDVVGAYASKTFDGTDNPGAVSLTFKHAVAKMQFKARVEAASGTVQATIDIKQVAVRHTQYSGTYAIPTSTNETGVLTAGTDKDDLFTDMRTGTAFLSKDDAAATDLGSVFMLPQSVTADALGTTPWNDAYIAVLAQVRIKDGSADETMLFPNVGAVNTTDYAWLAVPMPAEFTAMEAHHKYVFTLHFSADALGKIDPTQDPYAPDPNNPDETIDPDDPNDPNGGFINPDDEGQDIVPEGKSANPVTVTVQNIYDFEEDGGYELNEPTQAGPVAYTECPNDQHPHWIDLGLPSGTLWQCCNEGATAPEGYGEYYTFDDAQSYNPPTKAQINELLNENNTTSEWTTLNNVNGRWFTSKNNGGKVFLPAAGYRWGGGLYDAGSGGHYWSSSLNESNPDNAYYLYFNSSDASCDNGYDRYEGYTVRPVR